MERGQVQGPIIGITMDSDREGEASGRPYYFLNCEYVEMVRRVGGIAVTLPPTPEDENIGLLLELVDGLILSGGSDVDPAAYGEPVRHTNWDIDPERTVFEAKLVRSALKLDLPVLGICRGFQLLNVALGGSLYQDLAGEFPNWGPVRHRAESGSPPARHWIRVEGKSLLGSLLGVERLEVNSYHHQGVKELGRNLVAVAWSEDGLVEAVELPSCSFCLGVQWHPERDFDSPEQQLLLRAFLRAAERHRERRAFGAGSQLSRAASRS
ncbi:MAG: gamma-glutamyl-gamma-aminobutyrate hydrolase family protein [candidate division KSB1 bacterium]|nr:gamma-glutamyl-gamma-aminobutyrate hydrolase family protein [candidate division KSB1 bacterium]